MARLPWVNIDIAYYTIYFFLNDNFVETFILFIPVRYVVYISIDIGDVH